MQESQCISCNSCGSKVDGIAYRTSCMHFFCPNCASSQFERENSCPICNIRLQSGDVSETTTGVQNISLVESLFQSVLQKTDWNSIISNQYELFNGVAEITRFFYVQSEFQILIAKKESAEYQNRTNLILTQQVKTTKNKISLSLPMPCILERI